MTLFSKHTLPKIAPSLLAGISLIALSFAVTAQSKLNGAANSASPTVQSINLEGLKTLLNRDKSDPKPLLVNFWATWCDPCREEFPDLVKIDKDYRGKGLEFVAISLDDVTELKTGVPEFLQLMRATMPVYLLDENDPGPAITLVDPKWSGALPATILYDHKGIIVYKHFGRFRDAELRAAIEKALTNKGEKTVQSSAASRLFSVSSF